LAADNIAFAKLGSHSKTTSKLRQKINDSYLIFDAIIFFGWPVQPMRI